MWRRAAIEGIRHDPAWAGGDYTSEPVQGLRTAETLLQIAGMAPAYLQTTYPTRDASDAYVVDRIDRGLAGLDANDLLYQLEASRNYNPLSGLERIHAPMTWVNSADDFINPPELGIAEAAARRMPSARYVLIPASAETRGPRDPHLGEVLERPAGRSAAADRALTEKPSLLQGRGLGEGVGEGSQT